MCAGLKRKHDNRDMKSMVAIIEGMEEHEKMRKRERDRG